MSIRGPLSYQPWQDSALNLVDDRLKQTNTHPRINFAVGLARTSGFARPRALLSVGLAMLFPVLSRVWVLSGSGRNQRLNHSFTLALISFDLFQTHDPTISRKIQGEDKHNDLYFFAFVATPAGFEPATCPLGGGCSIQLSHGATHRLLYLGFLGLSWPLHNSCTDRPVHATIGQNNNAGALREH